MRIYYRDQKNIFGEGVGLLVTFLHEITCRKIEIPSAPTKAENQALLEELAGEGFRIAASNSPRANRADDLEDKAKDMEFLFEYMNGQAKNSIMLGYSLGSLSAILAGAEINTAGVIAIAPPTHEFERLGIPVPTPFNPEITMIIGANDSVAPTQYSIPFAKDFTPQGDTFIIEGGTHMGFIAGWGNPATVDAFLCQRFKRESHYPADYRCPPAKSNSIARRAQQGQATKIVWDTLKKWNFL